MWLQQLDVQWWTRRLPEIHARIEAPIHLFWGERDGFFPVSGARTMAQTFKQRGELKVIAGAKLYVHEEAASEVASFSLPSLANAFANAQPGTRGGTYGATLQS